MSQVLQGASPQRENSHSPLELGVHLHFAPCALYGTKRAPFLAAFVAPQTLLLIPVSLLSSNELNQNH